MDIDKIVVVTKKTPLEELVNRLNSKAQAQFYLEQNQVSFAEYERFDSTYQRAVAEVRQQLPRGIKQQFIDRAFLPTYQFGEHDLVLTIGPDGLVINVAKYLNSQPILAINPDPTRIDGVLLPFTSAGLKPWIERALAAQAKIAQVSMARATLNDGQVLDGVNDLFIGPRSHGSARYMLEFAGKREQHSSSGIIVSTGAGCTGWLQSIVAGAWQVAQHFSDTSAAPPNAQQLALGWDSDRLWFTVREPFSSRASQAGMVFGQIGLDQELLITSQMPDGGVIFSDGIESDYLAFNSGAVAHVGLSPRKAQLIVR